MRLTCPKCGAEYEPPAHMMPDGGRHVRCSACGTEWFASRRSAPRLTEDQIIARLEARDPPPPPRGAPAPPREPRPERAGPFEEPRAMPAAPAAAPRAAPPPPAPDPRPAAPAPAPRENAPEPPAPPRPSAPRRGDGLLRGLSAGLTFGLILLLAYLAAPRLSETPILGPVIGAYAEGIDALRGALAAAFPQDA